MPHLFHIQLFGMILKDLGNNQKSDNNQGNLAICYTNDGTITIRNDFYNESFHNHTGALKESIEKFINPSELSRFRKNRKLFVLDVCLGLGYNTASLLENIIKKE